MPTVATLPDMARRPVSASQADHPELLSFFVRSEAFCVGISAVREIRGWIPATPLPHAPPFVCGVVNLRGTVLPIIDLGARLGHGPTEPTDRHAIIVAEAEDKLVGLLVDGVNGILTVRDEDVHPTPDLGTDGTNEFVVGIITTDDRMISILSLDSVLPARPAALAA